MQSYREGNSYYNHGRAYDEDDDNASSVAPDDNSTTPRGGGRPPPPPPPPMHPSHARGSMPRGAAGVTFAANVVPSGSSSSVNSPSKGGKTSGGGGRLPGASGGGGGVGYALGTEAMDAYMMPSMGAPTSSGGGFIGGDGSSSAINNNATTREFTRFDDPQSMIQEIQRLRETIQAASSGSLEAKYFEQVKKNRELGVKLESEKARLVKLQSKVVEMEKTKDEAERMASRGVLMPSQAARLGGSAVTFQQQQSYGKAVEAEADILAAEVEELKMKLERSARSNTSLRKQLERRRALLLKLKQVMLVEIGSETDLDRALKSQGLSLASAFSDGGEALDGNPDDTPDASMVGGAAGGSGSDATAGGPPSPTQSIASKATTAKTTGGGLTNASAVAANVTGWRGRAQQIAILKSKVKDMQREMEAFMAQQQEGGHPDPGSARGVGGAFASDAEIASTIAFDGPNGPTISVAPASIAAASSRPGVRGFGGAQSVVSGAGSVVSRLTRGTGRDAEDAQRDRIEAAERKRMQEARELANTLRQRDEELVKERQKADSYNARLQVLERDNQHLKNCLSRMVEKTENDDQLIKAYKNDLLVKENELVKLRRDGVPGSGPTAFSGTMGRTAAGGGRSGGGTEAAELARLSAENARLTETIADLRVKEQRNRAAAASSMMASGAANPTTVLQSLPPEDALVAIFEHQGVHSDDGSLLGSAKAIVEKQRATIVTLETHLQRLQGVSGAQQQLVAAGGGAGREEITSLRERVAALTELMEREIQLHRAIAEGGGGASRGGVASATGGSQRRTVVSAGGLNAASSGPHQPPRQAPTSAPTHTKPSKRLGEALPPIGGRNGGGVRGPSRASTVESSDADPSSRGGAKAMWVDDEDDPQGALDRAERDRATTPPESGTGHSPGPSSHHRNAEDEARTQQLEADLKDVKKQYAELRKAYNAMASKQQQSAPSAAGSSAPGTANASTTNGSNGVRRGGPFVV